MNLPVYTVSQVSRYIKEMFDADEFLAGVCIRGEISNYKAYPSGHHYFSLKDAESSIRCVMFRREAASLRFRPENGMSVMAFGRITVFPRDGQYQLYVTALHSDGVGDLHVAFEQLKARLNAEGLFDPAHKRALPRFPQEIALVTSPAGAAVQDMLRILKARWPLAAVTLVGVRVQGSEAPAEIAAGIDAVNRAGTADLIITGRGGGSMEDLWAFNEEIVARAIYRSAIPVISAVGHEPDVTIADFVADLRAATPSNAAELAVPDRSEISARLGEISANLARAARRRTETARASLDRWGASRALTDPLLPIEERRLLLDRRREALSRALSDSVREEKTRLAGLCASLDAMSPLKVLARGYAIADTPDGRIVTSPDDVSPGDPLRVRVRDGVIPCTVTKED